MLVIAKVCRASCLVVFTTACASSSTMAARTGLPRPPLPAECVLELIDGNQAPTGTSLGNELIGSVTANVDEGIGPLDPQLKALVRPEACKLGGTALSLLSSSRVRKDVILPGWRELHTFSVWAPYTTSAPASF